MNIFEIYPNNFQHTDIWTPGTILPSVCYNNLAREPRSQNTCALKTFHRSLPVKKRTCQKI